MAASVSTEQAFADCQRLATTHYENFSVLSWFLPHALRPHFSSVYAFCRHTDDLGDEGAPTERLARLDAWEADLRRCFNADQSPKHPYLIALRETIRRFDLPDTPFLRLIEANRMDQRVSRYPTYADVLRYCEHSANPVGRLVLMLYGYRDEERQRCSDAICTALQLTNFWQDIASDYHERGRIYLPAEDMARFGCDEAALARGEATPAFRALMAFEVERARSLFAEGMPLLGRLPGLPRRAIALFALGGLEVLAAIERRGYDVFAQRPTLSSRRKLWLMARVALSK
ncbi:MAG TPA: squalene synthase HpnC [Ktedonobacterales bacterium]|nr:squalene synthase HpnC [Ktedonobacterales bacterium]